MSFIEIKRVLFCVGCEITTIVFFCEQNRESTKKTCNKLSMKFSGF